MPVCHVQSTPAGLRTPDRYSAAAWPLVCEKQRLPRKVFRRSIAWLSDSLSTLRRAGYPATTQDSLPAAGQALPDGLPTRRVPAKGFRVLPYISSSFPKLCLAQSHRPTSAKQHKQRTTLPKWNSVRRPSLPAADTADSIRPTHMSEESIAGLFCWLYSRGTAILVVAGCPRRAVGTGLAR